MSTTTIRIDDDLKARLAAVAAHAGKTPHALILDAVAEAVERAEADQELHRLANERWANLQQTGQSVPWNDAKTYLQARAAGKAPRKPKARVPVR
jgi:predicted transcriptional regulator